MQCTVSSIEMNVSKKYIEVYGSEADPNHNDKWKPDPNHNEKWKPDPNHNEKWKPDPNENLLKPPH